ncbi:MAG: carboxypeptidase-like regulatory domain-containing protein, partial [Bacteroides graminisolvens]|nr:carboxypeptidase-like regulatory domain-containing protein [Bacteroides graminisolvens]
MKRKLMLLLTCLFVGIGLVTAQTQRVTGNVTSEEDGLPVVGASVLVKGTTVGTITDIDGNFTLSSVPTSAKVLQVSYIGMQSQEVAIKPSVKVILKNDAKALDEVVVTALGIKKSEKILGYAASTVKSDQLDVAKSGSVMGGLTSKVAGVQISGAGATGTSQKVLVRGISSLNSNSPLYIVDGVPIDNSLNGTTNDNATDIAKE